MDSNSEENKAERMPQYNEVIAFDPDEFVTTFGWAMNAAFGGAHVTNPEKLRFNLVDDDGGSSQMGFADTPLARINIALLERYADVDIKKYYSAAFRIFALMKLRESGRLAPWVRSVPGDASSEELAVSVIEAAASVRLNKELLFPVREFIRKVKEIERGAK